MPYFFKFWLLINICGQCLKKLNLLNDFDEYVCINQHFSFAASFYVHNFQLIEILFYLGYIFGVYIVSRGPGNAENQ